MAETTSGIIADIRLNLEGECPRSAYLLHCQQHGVNYTEEGYLQWRAVGERLTGRPSFETSMKRACDAIAKMGVGLNQLGVQMRAIFQQSQDAEERAVSRRHADADR